MSSPPERALRSPVPVVAGIFGLNLLLFAAAAVVFLHSGSQLVLAQGADSFFDLVAGAVLTMTARIGLQPRDEDHPFGHGRAEPIGALVTAVLAGVLAVEVLRSAMETLASGHSARLDVWVVSVLGGKVLLKGILLVGLARWQHGSPALRASLVDTRNDIAASGSSLVAFFLARAGIEWADAGLAIPVALYVGWNGFGLARENLRYLMGEAPSAEVQEELRSLAAGVRGVLAVTGIRAQFAGPVLQVEVTILVRENASVTQGHDISIDVQDAVGAHSMVGEVFVHVDTDAARDHE